MPAFKKISYGPLLYETLRAYYSVNSAGNLSILYKYLLAIVQPLQGPFNAYDTYRTKEAIIANCKWQIGQLTNVLNYLYDRTLSRIFITQSAIAAISDPMFAYAPTHFDQTYADAPPEIFERTFSDRVATTLVTINVPVGVNISDLTATVEQIKITGIPYKIVTF
jgi:hypothetical protein